MSARLPSWAWVTGLTAGAVAVVAVLAVRADQGPRPEPTAARPSVSAPASADPKPKVTETAPPAVPKGSGTGRRIVYSLSQQRVWLVDASDATRRSFTVWPGTVAPDPGSYKIGTRTETTTGSDGVPIEHVVFFANKDGIDIAFSNALDGSSPPPAQGRRTGGIRTGKDAGDALWAFATTGTAVRVVS